MQQGVEGLRIGVPTNDLFDQLDGEVESAVRAAHAGLENLGAALVDVALPMPEQIVPVEFAILLPEANAYHRRSHGSIARRL